MFEQKAEELTANDLALKKKQVRDPVRRNLYAHGLLRNVELCCLCRSVKKRRGATGGSRAQDRKAEAIYRVSRSENCPLSILK